MSHHILHVFQHGAVLGRERGFITCKADGQAERRLPLDDVRAVIIAARGVTISSNFLSGLLETDAIVLHCDERYQPCGWTAPLARTVDLKTFQNQTATPKLLNEKLWHEMLRGKTLNGPGTQPMPSATVAGNFLGRQPGAIEAMGKSVRVGLAI